MLHRAATTTYSWWWASHIRTKQSKWLEQNLQDMEEKVKSMVKIIDQEGDSFAKRAEMYYKKRPELINFVEESFKAYRSMAERFDHISKDLQSANRTIATVFPEQVHLDLESDDEEDGLTAPSPDRLTTKVAPKNLPKAPKLPKQNLKGQSMLASKRDHHRKNIGSSPLVISSGLSKEEAIKEIESLQKDILISQTEKEFIKSAYENALAKFLELESKLTESQSKVCSLQDEFGIGTVIEDHEARTLMADSALKSCKETMVKLQKEQKKSMEEVEEECQKIKEVQKRLEALKLLHKHGHEPEPEPQTEPEPQLEPEKHFDENITSLREKIKDQLKLDSDASFTTPEMADMIDDMVEKIIQLEMTICSLNALVKRLRQDVETLLDHIRSLEEQKQSSTVDSAMSVRLRELEIELISIKKLVTTEVADIKKNITEEITKAECNLEHLKEILPNVKPHEDSEYLWLSSKEVKAEPEVEPHKEYIEHDSEKDEDDEDEKRELSRTIESSHEFEAPLGEEDGLNWRQLYLNNIEDREKILVEEYTIILRDYKNMKMKLTEIEKTHRDDNFELRSLVDELRNAIIAKDQEIQMLRKMLSELQNNNANVDSNARSDSNVEESKKLKQDKQNSGDDDGPISPSGQNMKPLFHHLYSREGIINDTIDEDEKKSSVLQSKRVKISLVTKTRPVSRTEGKFRAEMDNLLEANLDFWLRFSTSFHQIQKFQTIIKDLLIESSKLNENPQQSTKSDARPLYKHLREIETELTLWLEHSAVFQEELRSRFNSLNSIQDEITKVSNPNDGKGEKNELSDYQLAKFQGEILNMKQENSKVANELEAGVHRVKALKVDVGKAMSRLDKEFGLFESKSRSSSLRHQMSKSKIPLRSLLFGMKLRRNKHKTPSPPSSSSSAAAMYACANAPLPRTQVSILEFPH